MKLSEQWLREWVPTPLDVDALCERLTGAGLEVDGTAPAAPDCTGVVTARVLSVQPHDHADHLSVCRVDAGAGPASIVCGAPNVRPGLTAALATVGARLPGGERIEAASLRGVVSNGMLLSAAELGLGDDADGILELDGPYADCAPGTNVRAALGLDDTTINLDLTPNRGDALCIRGVARELGVLCDVGVVEPGIEPVPAATDASFPVRVDNFAACPRYLGRVVRGVDGTRRTPLWMRERLRRCGLRPIHPVVDVTNYVLLELGQPMHAFDLGALNDGIVVRDARPGESLTLLDGQALTLGDGTRPPLLITDGGGPVALAGVMGGERSGVSDHTQDVFLECALFDTASIAATARRFGLNTDAAHRYERGVDYELQHLAMQRATRLLIDLCGGEAGPVLEAVDPGSLPQPRSVRLRKARLDRLVGESLSADGVQATLARLQLQPRVEGRGEALSWSVTSPSHRYDIEREEDLVEEVLRIHGYNAIEGRVPGATLPLGASPADRAPEARLADLLADLGYHEAVTYSFVPAAAAHLLDPGAETVRVLNPVSQEHAVMRTNLLPGLTAALRRNLARQATRVRLFETGQCFRQRDGELRQTGVCGGILIGSRDLDSWTRDAEAVDFFDVKGDVESLLALGGREVEFEAATDPVLHPGQSAIVRIRGEAAGRLGRLHPELESALELPPGVFVFELDVDAALALRPRRHRAVSRHPSVRRDLALVVDAAVPAARIEAVARQALGELAAGFRVFDVHFGANVEKGKKSIAVALTLQHPSRTLYDEEISERVAGVVSALGDQLGARLREA